MPPLITRMLFIFVFIFLLNLVRRFAFTRALKNKVEMPNRIQRVALGIQTFIVYLFLFMAIIGVVMKDAEMAIVPLVLTVIAGTIVYFTRRKFKKYYEETDEYFYLNGQYQVDYIYYENITDWVPLKKQIGVLDPTQSEDQYVIVNFVFHDPEILLEKLANMTFAGKFEQADESKMNDPLRKQEFIDHLKKNGYGHIVEGYLEAEPSE